MLPKAIGDPVNSKTSKELQNVPNAPPNSEDAFPAQIRVKDLFLYKFITHQFLLELSVYSW